MPTNKELQDFISSSGLNVSSNVSRFADLNVGAIRTAAREQNVSLPSGLFPNTNFPSAPSGAEDTPLADIQKPASLAEIRGSEDFKTAEERRRESAGRLFDPRIREEKATGAAREGATGVQSSISRGLGVSSSRQSMLNTEIKNTNERVDFIEKQKAEYIDSGLWEEAKFMMQEKNDMIKFQNELIREKAAIVREDIRFEKTFGLSKDQFAFNKEQAEQSMAINIANLTGVYEGDPTFASKQAEIANAMSIAGLTGIYKDEPTLAAETARLDRVLRERGIVIQEGQLSEMIRHNMASESRLAGGSGGVGTAPEFSGDYQEDLKDVSGYLSDLRESGKLNDSNYDFYVSRLVESLYGELEGEAATERFNEISSEVNKAMEFGGESIAEAEPGAISDFEAIEARDEVISTPEKSKFIKGKRNIEEIKSKVVSLLSTFRNTQSSKKEKDNAEKELRNIPEFIEGERVWNRSLSGV